MKAAGRKGKQATVGFPRGDKGVLGVEKEREGYIEIQTDVATPAIRITVQTDDR